MTVTRGARLGLLLALATSLAGWAAPAPLTARVAVCDWVVGGPGTPRYWLGPLQAEVLSRRLRLGRQLLVTDAFTVRRADTGLSVSDLDSLGAKMTVVAQQFTAEYVISGLIIDEGDKLKVQPVVLLKGNPKPFAPAVAEVTLDMVFQPQVDTVVGRFVRQMGLKLIPEDFVAMQKYQPSAVPKALELVGSGWRSWRPDQPLLAMDQWREALRQDPDCALAAEAICQASLAYRRALFEETRKLAQAQVTARPDDAHTHYALALVYADAGNWRDAATCYERAVILKPTLVEAKLGLGVAYMWMNNLSGALTQFTEIVELEPHNRKALYNAGLVYLRQSNVKDALKLWTAGAKAFPDDKLFREAIDQINNTGANPLLEGLQ